MKNNHIIIGERNRKHILAPENILRIESVRVYSIFYLRIPSEQIVSSRTLGKVYSELNHEIFFRVHKSHIVNLHEIKIFVNSRCGKVILSDDTVINVAQRRKTELLKHLYQLNKKIMYEKQKIKNDPRATVRIDITRHTK